MIEVRNLYKSYELHNRQVNILDCVNFTFSAGTSTSIIGKSGSGKSSLLHIMANLDQPTTGSVLYDGKEEISSKSMGFIFQKFFLSSNQTCLENVMLPLALQGVFYWEQKRRAEQALKSVGMLDFAYQKAGILSGGEQQRVCIARAIVGNPLYLFADEPTGNLDSKTGIEIISLLYSIQKKCSATLVIVTHDLDIAETCDVRTQLIDGKLNKI